MALLFSTGKAVRCTMALVLLSPEHPSKGGVKSMNESRRVKSFAVLGLAIAGLLGSRMFAQDRPKSETAMTGCLNKGSAGVYTLTDEKTGVKTTITGPADLEKHSANHKVTLTG